MYLRLHEKKTLVNFVISSTQSNVRQLMMIQNIIYFFFQNKSLEHIFRQTSRFIFSSSNKNQLKTI